MTTIAEGAEILRKAKEAGTIKPVPPGSIPIAYPVPPLEAGLNPLLRGPMPAGSVNNADTVRQWNLNAIPQTRILPLPTTSNPVAGAQAASQAITQIANTPAAASGVTSVGLTAPNIFVIPVSGSPVTSAGTLALALAPELPNTVFAAPTTSAGNVAIDSVATTTGSFPTSATGPYSATVTTTAANDLVICVVPQGFGSTFTTPSGFTTISGLGSPPGFLGYKVVPTTGALTVGGVSNGGEQWLEILAAFKGSATATVRQSTAVTANFGANNFTNPLGSAVLAGSTIIAIPISSIGSPSATVGPGTFAITDSQNNVYQMLASNFSPSPTPGTGSSTFGQMFSSVVPTTAGTLNFTITNPSHLWGGVSCWILEVTNLAPPVQTPEFRYLAPTDIPGMSSGVLDLLHGGTAANLSATGGTSNFLRQNSSGAVVTVVQPDFSDLAGAAGKFATSYNGIALVSNGIPTEYATVDLTAKAAAITATTLYTSAATGMFRISAYLKVTTVDATSSTLGPVTITFTDGTDSIAQSNVMVMATQTGSAATSNSGNTTVSSLSGQMIVYALSGVAIQYAVAYASNVPGTMKYEVHLKAEAL